MSVVRRAALRRWATVLTGIALLCSIPPVLAARPLTEPPGAPVDSLVAQALASAAVPHSGLTEVQARLGLPVLPQLAAVSRLLNGRTRARVWWASPARWRVAELTATGERDLTKVRQGIATWDYDNRVTRTVTGEPAIRLPRVDDLLPPQAARRLLNTLGPDDRVERIPAQRVAGITAVGLRIRPGDSRSRISDVSMWLHPATGLPLAIEVRDPRHEEAVLSTRFLDVSLDVPPSAVTESVNPSGSRRETSRTTDFAADVDRSGPWRLPERLAGLPRADARTSVGGVTGGAGTYGRGLTRFVVLPLRADVASDALRRTRVLARPLEIAGGEAVPLERPLLTVVVARGDPSTLPGQAGDHAYLLAGTVDVGLLTDAVTELFEDPPPPREATR